MIVEAVCRAEDESATWLKADLARHVATLIAPTGADAASTISHIDRLAAAVADRCVGLAPAGTGPLRRDGRPVSEAVTDRRLTTQRVLDQETGLQAWAGHAATGPTTRDDPHGAAVDAIAGGGGLTLVVGPAGTGKTTATAAAVERLHEQRRPVVAVAPSGKAADVLGTEAGCQATTVAAFLLADEHQRSRWPARTTVIVDEAGMATTDDLHRLATLAEAYQWRVVCVGDPEQLAAVGRGGTFTHWTTTLPHHQLDQPRRFTEPWEATASLALRAGDPTAAEAYAAHGRLATTHPVLLPDRVARRYVRHDQAGQTVAITTTTAETARAINVAIQRATAPPRRTTVRLADGTRTGVGDTVAARRNDRRLVTDQGDQVRNRQIWTVLHAHPDGALTAHHPDRGCVELPAGYVANDVELGWAVTGYGNQGDTTDVAIAVLEPHTTRNHAYVALTRGRHTNTALILDATGTADPADALATIVTRPSRTESALATQQRLRGQEPAPPVPPDRNEAIRRRLGQVGRTHGGPSVPQR